MVESINLEPDWNGMLRYVHAMASSRFSSELEAVAITGGEDTAFYCRITSGEVWVFDKGIWIPTDKTWDWVSARSLHSKETVNG
jgi:hypothetical protein